MNSAQDIARRDSIVFAASLLKKDLRLGITVILSTKLGHLAFRIYTFAVTVSTLKLYFHLSASTSEPFILVPNTPKRIADSKDFFHNSIVSIFVRSMVSMVQYHDTKHINEKSRKDCTCFNQEEPERDKNSIKKSKK